MEFQDRNNVNKVVIRVKKLVDQKLMSPPIYLKVIVIILIITIVIIIMNSAMGIN